jgi:outer membrane biosynthesis protein TonB
MVLRAWTIVAATLLASEPAAARLKLASLPPLPGPAVGSGEVLLEVAVDATGRVAEVRTLRDSPPYTEPLRATVKDWLFEPARDAAGQPAAAEVLVAGWFRPATVTGPAPGDPPRDVAKPSGRAPFPQATAPALYPPLARGDGQVIVEVSVAADGTAAARLFRAEPGFGDAALQAARDWRFRPFPGGGRAYLVFGFRGIPG